MGYVPWRSKNIQGYNSDVKSALSPSWAHVAPVVYPGVSQQPSTGKSPDGGPRTAGRLCGGNKAVITCAAGQGCRTREATGPPRVTPSAREPPRGNCWPIPPVSLGS